jgi:Arc/MetJ-type ribon-helix-helix transcriptional regulator
MREITVQLNDELLDFIDRQAEGDDGRSVADHRDHYLVKALSHYRRWSLQQEMIQALQAESSDPEYQAEIALWDCTVGDGLDAAG